MTCLLIVFSIVLCAIPVFANGEPEPATVKVVVATKDIAKGRMITDQNLKLITVKNENLPTNYISDPSKVVGKYAKVDIFENEYIFNELLSSEKVLMTNSDILVKPLRECTDDYLVVTDYIFADSGKDVTGALQELIDKNPNRTIYFPDGEYLISSPIFTSATGRGSVSLQLSDGAVIKAMKTWKSAKYGDGNTINALICSGGAAPVNDIVSVGSYYSIKGGVLDGSGKADGIELVSGRETLVRNICLRDVKKGIIVGKGANNGSSDMDFEDITIYGTGRVESVGISITGFDNTFTNIRIYNVSKAISEGSGGNLFKNIYAYNDMDKLDVYTSTVAFAMSSPWMSQCYAENFSVAYSVGSGAELWDCTAKWTSERCVSQTAVSAASPPPALSGIRAEFYPGVEDTCMFKFSGQSVRPVIDGCMYDPDLCKEGFNEGYLNTPIIPHKSK